MLACDESLCVDLYSAPMKVETQDSSESPQEWVSVDC